MDYGKLAEQYGGFLVAIGGVSITVLTLVLSIWHLKRSPEENDTVSTASSNRPALITSLIIATFCCFVGAHLMAETSAFISSITQGTALKANVGARQFLLASINIFIGVTVVMFAVMLLATEYRKEDESSPGIRTMSMLVFCAVVGSVLWWMFFTIVARMPVSNEIWLSYVAVALVAFVGGLLVGLATLLKRSWTLTGTFFLIVGFTFFSLIYFSLSLRQFSLGLHRLDFAFFVAAITSTCIALMSSAYRLVYKQEYCPLFSLRRLKT